MAAASRGLGGVTNESRSFDQDGQGVALDGGQIVLTSTINFDAPVEGQVVHYAVSRVTLAFDRPASAGTFDLATLHAKVCEIVKDTWTPACGAVTGTLTYRPDGSQKLDGDLVIDSTPPGDGPALSGSASFHYEVHTSTDWCPDLGGPHGVMSPE
jgi:hypothetical protein